VLRLLGVLGVRLLGLLEVLRLLGVLGVRLLGVLEVLGLLGLLEVLLVLVASHLPPLRWPFHLLLM
jgi:hypothetical protein